MSLKEAKRIECENDRLVSKGKNGMDWSFPQPEVRLGSDWYIEKLEILSKAPRGSTVIDVGCKEGYWTGSIHGIIPPGVLRIGIDPIDYKVSTLRGGATPFNPVGGDPVLHEYYCCAIDDVDDRSSATFHIFDEPGCNSLLPKSEHLARTELKTITVPIMSLESLLFESGRSQAYIYFLKCDCQGKDVSVVKSLRSFLARTDYVQIETSFSRERPFYKEQPCHDDDVKEMEEIGFRPIYYVEYNGSPLPEGEILFKRVGLP